MNDGEHDFIYDLDRDLVNQSVSWYKLFNFLLLEIESPKNLHRENMAVYRNIKIKIKNNKNKQNAWNLNSTFFKNESFHVLLSKDNQQTEKRRKMIRNINQFIKQKELSRLRPESLETLKQTKKKWSNWIKSEITKSL